MSGDMLADMFAGLCTAARGASSPYVESAVNFFSYVLRHHDKAYGQRFQDLFALFVLSEKRDGYFVEIGACDGLDLSNTLLLEKSYGWRGIVSEAAHVWHGALTRNRSAKVDTRYVWSQTGHRLEFAEATLPELSTQLLLADRDFNAKGRVLIKRYQVETISLNDLLSDHGAPAELDYLSIDTEGSEPQILRALDFTRYRPRIITVEHNYRSPDREELGTLLQSWGYIRVFDMMSAWDDWYIQRSVARG